MRAASLGLAGAASAALVGCGDDDDEPVDLADETLPPEVTTVKLPMFNGLLCLGPMVLAADFLAGEGISVEYVLVPETESMPDMAHEGKLDFVQEFASAVVPGVARGLDLTFLAGVHSGCIEVFAREGIDSLTELAGKRIGIPFGDNATSVGYEFAAGLLSFIGVPADRNVQSYNFDRLPALFESGEIDAVVAAPPLAENVRALPDVRVILSTVHDSPWSDYYCCMLFANARFVKDKPMTTLRVVRSVLKATDMLSGQPERAAARLVELGSPLDYDKTLEFVQHMPYDLWHTADPVDSLQFYALRLHDVGAIDATPDEILEHGDWRFLDQLKQEIALAPGGNGRNLSFYCDPTTGVPRALANAPARRVT
jgi:NitT/TauT family transport system substrate-binding protein